MNYQTFRSCLSRYACFSVEQAAAAFPGFSRANCVFLGWDADPNATTPTFEAGRKIAADNLENAARSVKETIEKAWDELSADDPEGCPFGMENEDEPAGEKPEEDIPTIEVKPDDTDRE